VAFITGSGLKTVDVLGRGGGRTLRIRPTLRDFEREVLAAV